MVGVQIDKFQSGVYRFQFDQGIGVMVNFRNLLNIIYFDVLKTVWWHLSHGIDYVQSLVKSCNLPHYCSKFMNIFNLPHLNRNYRLIFLLFSSNLNN